MTDTKRQSGNEVKKAVANSRVKSVKWCGRYWYVVVDVQGVDTDANADQVTRDVRKACGAGDWSRRDGEAGGHDHRDFQALQDFVRFLASPC